MRAFAPGQLDALLEAGRVAKVACMRRTLFIESAQLVPVVLAATRELLMGGHERFLAANGLTRADYEQIAERIEAQLAGRALGAREIRDALGGTERISPVIIVMCDEARLIRWKGSSWSSAQPTYRHFDEVLPGVRRDGWEEQSAVRELVARYVRRYGPVTEDDVTWWTGLPRVHVRDALASLTELVRARIGASSKRFLIHESDIAAAQRRRGPAAAEISLLPVLDPYLQGYRYRDRCVDPRHLPFVVDRGGNSTSVILTGGRVAGIWDLVMKPSPELRLFFFEAPGPGTRTAVHVAASDLAEFVTGAPAPVIEVAHMTPLSEGTTGSFQSPLRDAR